MAQLLPARPVRARAPLPAPTGVVARAACAPRALPRRRLPSVRRRPRCTWRASSGRSYMRSAVADESEVHAVAVGRRASRSVRRDMRDGGDGKRADQRGAVHVHCFASRPARSRSRCWRAERVTAIDVRRHGELGHAEQWRWRTIIAASLDIARSSCLPAPDRRHDLPDSLERRLHRGRPGARTWPRPWCRLVCRLRRAATPGTCHQAVRKGTARLSQVAMHALVHDGDGEVVERCAEALADRAHFVERQRQRREAIGPSAAVHSSARDAP